MLALQDAYEARDGWELPFLAVYPLYAPLRSDERFQAIVRGVLGPLAPAFGQTKEATSESLLDDTLDAEPEVPTAD
ncbi:MAG: hypothetical protein AAF604_18710 [Acidobacteriota bacterium]